MNDDEINDVVTKLLRQRLKNYGFRGSTVRSEEDFDGVSILRVTAHLEKGNLPFGLLTDVLHDIRSKLLTKGEERFVLLNSESPEDEVIDEDVE